MPKLPRLTLLLLLIGAPCARAPAADRPAQPPNIVFILIDDMPWFGTPVRMSPDLPESAMAFRHMPNVEKLAAQGMTFRNAYAAAGMCGPSRCSIQTGMMTARHLYSGNGGFGEKTNGTVEYLSRGQDAARPLLQPEPQGNLRFPSIGDLCKSAGYATAHFGKWHLYGGGPAKHGYDESDGDTDNKTSRPDDPPDDPKLMFSITRRSVDFIERQAKAGRPFFVQVSHYATHARYQATKKTRERYEKNPVFAKIAHPRDRQNAILGAAMVEDLDTTIGQLLQTLDIYILNVLMNGLGMQNDWSFLNRMIDTRALAMSIFKQVKYNSEEDFLCWQMKLMNHFEKGIKTSQGFLLKHYGIEHDPAMLHNALYDIKMNYKIFRRQISEVEI